MKLLQLTEQITKLLKLTKYGKKKRGIAEKVLKEADRLVYTNGHFIVIDKLVSLERWITSVKLPDKCVLTTNAPRRIKLYTVYESMDDSGINFVGPWKERIEIDSQSNYCEYKQVLPTDDTPYKSINVDIKYLIELINYISDNNDSVRLTLHEDTGTLCLNTPDTACILMELKQDEPIEFSNTLSNLGLNKNE